MKIELSCYTKLALLQHKMEQEETTRRESKIKNSNREEKTVLMIWWVEQWKSKNYQSTKDKVS